MEVQQMCQIQAQFDDSRGWRVKSPAADQVIRSLQENTIGLLGEIGEFANMLKKVSRDSRGGSRELGRYLKTHRAAMVEEAVDALIYLIRIFDDLDADLESAYLEKLKTNKRRFRVGAVKKLRRRK